MLFFLDLKMNQTLHDHNDNCPAQMFIKKIVKLVFFYLKGWQDNVGD